MRVYVKLSLRDRWRWPRELSKSLSGVIAPLDGRRRLLQCRCSVEDSGVEEGVVEVDGEE
jgi:hypothetical protein